MTSRVVPVMWWQVCVGLEHGRHHSLQFFHRPDLHAHLPGLDQHVATSSLLSLGVPCTGLPTQSVLKGEFPRVQSIALTL